MEKKVEDNASRLETSRNNHSKPETDLAVGDVSEPPKLNQNNIITKHVMVLVKGSSKVDNVPSTMNFKIIVSI